MEEAAVMMVGMDIERIMQGLKILETQNIGEKRNMLEVSDYSMPNVSDKVLRILISYTNYIKQNVWKEN
jgi:UDP-N-acetylglucosamine 2-epimerase (non-hydrolysing)